jgi:polysaccharide export outer membrane protein
MKFIYTATCFLLLSFFCSCTSTEKLTYLQDQKSDNFKANELIKTMRLQESQYKLQPSDRLQVNISSSADEKLNFIKTPQFEAVVDQNGRMDLPGVTEGVIVSGLTMKQAEQRMDTLLAKRYSLPGAFVTLKLLNFNYTVIGEVITQGTFNAEDPRVNVLEAIGKAGGLTENADREKIRIVRNENSTAKIYEINILEDNSLQSSNFFLQPNDIILINPLKSRAQTQQRTATIGLVISVISVVTSMIYLVFRNR